MRKFFVVAALAAVAQGASCPDGWSKVEVKDSVECVYFGGVSEGVTKADAEILCNYRGGHLVDMDESKGPAKNNAIKALLSDLVPGEPGRPGMQWDRQWWIGATCMGSHSEHNWGDWKWDSTSTEVEWFDWMRDEPNDWHSQDCLTFLKDQDIFGYFVWHWNDWDCDSEAGYICEKEAV